MADITFAQIEAAMVTRLESQMDYLADCASYAGQLEDANAGLPVDAPACFVMFDGYTRSADMSDQRRHVGTANFSVLTVAESYVGGTQTRTGEHGAYAMTQDVITALDDSTLGIAGFYGLNLVAVEMVLVNKVRAIYRVRFETLLEVSR